MTAPDGRTWTVRRRWLPGYATRAVERWRLRRVLDRASRALELGDGPTALDEIWIFVVVIAGLVLLFVALPLLIDVVVVLLAVLLGGVVRTLLRRPWTVEAVSGDERLTRPVVGWFASGRAARAWAEDLRHGF